MASNILQKIESSIPNLSSKQKIIALAILQDPLSAAFLSTKDFSDKINVSPATIVRFAQDITGVGYSKLQEELQYHIQSVSNPIKRMEMNVITDSEADELLASIYEKQLNNLRNTFNQSVFVLVKEACELIRNASSIFTSGHRASFCVAYFLGQHLNRAFGNVDIIPDDDKLADFCKKADENSVVIFVCVRRYSFRLLEAAKIIKKKKAKIITINDSSDSPFIPISDISFIAPCDSCDFHNSVIAPMLIAEMLISSMIAKDSSSTMDSLSDYEEYFSALNQFVIKD